MHIGTLDGLRRYPVKSMRGERLERADIAADGIPGDRASAFFALSGAREQKTYRGKEHDRLHLLDDPSAAATSAQRRGANVELRTGEHFFDDAPISLIVDRWLENLSSHAGYAVEWERFRPNLFVRASAEFDEPEEALNGAELQLGDVRLRVRYPIERCVAVTYHPQGAPADAEILRYLARHRQAWMGVYCDVLEPGQVRLGDALVRVAQGSS